MARVIALDANVFLLLVVGLTNPAYVASHKRLSAYTVRDFHTLRRILEEYDEAVVIPNALSETGNLIGWIKEPARTQILLAFREIVGRTREVYIPSKDASTREEFIRIGLTDSALLEIAKQDVFVLSADGHLYRAALASGYQAGHFTQFTEAASGLA